MTGHWTFTSPSVYMAINAVTMGYGCHWPQFSTQRDMVLSLAPGALQSLVNPSPLTNHDEHAPTEQRPFNFWDLELPVPAGVYFGNDFLASEWDDRSDKIDFEEELKDSIMQEGVYQPRVLIDSAIWSHNSLYASCRPFSPAAERRGLVAWDPQVILDGKDVTSIPGATSTAPIASPVPVVTPTLPTASPVPSVPDSPSRSTERPPSVPQSSQEPNVTVADLDRPDVPVSQIPPSPVVGNNPPSIPSRASPPAPSAEPIVFIPPRQGDSDSQHVIVVGTTVATLVAAGPPVTIGSRTISMDRGGVVYEQVRTAAPPIQTLLPPGVTGRSSVGAGSSAVSNAQTRQVVTPSFTPIGSLSSKTSNGVTEVTYVVDTGAIQPTSDPMTTSTVSYGLRRYSLTYCHHSIVGLVLILAFVIS
jgi:hypothetical protein